MSVPFLNSVDRHGSPGMSAQQHHEANRCSECSPQWVASCCSRVRRSAADNSIHCSACLKRLWLIALYLRLTVLPNRVRSFPCVKRKRQKIGVIPSVIVRIMPTFLRRFYDNFTTRGTGLSGMSKIRKCEES